MENPTQTAPPIASHDLLCVLREIEKTKKALASLYERKREIEDAAKAERWKAEKVEKADKHRLWVKMLEMASRGMSVAKIAEELGVSKHNMEWKLCRAWRKEFPEHFAVNYEKRSRMGFLSALRDSPPLFISSHNANSAGDPPTRTSTEAKQ